MALAANTDKYAGGVMLSKETVKDFIVKNGSTVYQGSLVIVDRGTGHLIPLANATAQTGLMGIALQKVVGDGTLTCSVIIAPMVIRLANVTGFSAQTKVGEPIYATDDGTLTLTRPSTYAVPVGIAQLYSSSGVGDILAFSALQAAILRLAGGDKEEIELGIFNLADLANSQVIKHTMYGHGKIVLIRANPVKPPTTSSKAATLTGDLGGTGITTGVLALTSANMAASGTPVDASPSALNEYYDGDVLTFTASSVTAFSQGTAKLSIVVQRLA